MASIGLRTEADGLEDALDGTEGVYVALDVDALEPGPIQPFMPEPGGLSLAELARAPTAGRGRTTGAGGRLHRSRRGARKRRASDRGSLSLSACNSRPKPQV